MAITLWDTNGAEIVKALAAERRAAGALASGLALTLVVVTDENHVAAAEEAATVAAASHPCRLLIVVRRRLEADDRLDAEVQVGGRLGPTEAIVMRMYGRLTLHAESVVLPLLAPDAPVVTWWHEIPPDKLAYDPLGVLANRRVTDASASERPAKALRVRAKDYAPGDTDLAWTRTTPWRSLLAAAFDGGTPRPTSAEVASQKENPSAALIAGWLKARLGIRVQITESGGPGVTAAEVRFEGEERLRIDRPDGRLATLTRSGRPERVLPLKRRELGDLIAEELRHLDADEPYAEALSATTGEKGLNERASMRTHIWRDPGEAARASSQKRTTKKSATTASAKKSSARKTTSKKTSSKQTSSRTAAKKSASKSASEPATRSGRSS
jgi:glucose-6-phosphate dehydrogenase assembly protein OpcA